MSPPVHSAAFFCSAPRQVRKLALIMQSILKMSQLFGGLDSRSLQEITAAASLKRLKAGEPIFHEGDSAAAFYIVGSGKVKIFKLSAEGKEQILMIAGPGDTFAEAALFGEGCYPASAETLETSDLVVIHRDRFLGVLERHPHLALNLIGRLSELLRKLTRLAGDLSLSDVTTRLARALLERVPPDAPGGSTFALSERKIVLASQIGTIPETLSRSLARLSRDKIIKVERAKITVLDLTRLRELAGE